MESAAEIAGLLATGAVARLTGVPISYSALSLAHLLLALLWPVHWPFVLTNSFGVAAGWYGWVVLYPEKYSALASKHGWTVEKLVLADMLAHALPVAVVLAKAPAALHWSVGVRSLMHHLAWALLQAGGLDLSRVYIPMLRSQWHVLWRLAACGHLAAALVYHYRHGAGAVADR